MIDSSVALSWCLPDETTPATLALLEMTRDGEFYVPAFWYIEMTNVLGIARKKGRLSEAGLKRSLRFLRTITIKAEAIEGVEAIENLLAIMQTYNLTAYDGAYLQIALRLQLPLATFDGRLASAAADGGVQVLQGRT